MKNIILESEWWEAPPGVQAEGLQIREWTWPRADPRIFKTKADRADQRRRGGKCSLRAPPLPLREAGGVHPDREAATSGVWEVLGGETGLRLPLAEGGLPLREPCDREQRSLPGLCCLLVQRRIGQLRGVCSLGERGQRKRKNRHQRKRTVRGREEHVSTSPFYILRGIQDRISSGLCRRLWKRSESRKGS